MTEMENTVLQFSYPKNTAPESDAVALEQSILSAVDAIGQIEFALTLVDRQHVDNDKLAA